MASLNHSPDMEQSEHYKTLQAEVAVLQQKLLDLTQTNQILQRQLDMFQIPQMQQIAERRRAALEFYHQEFAKNNPDYTPVQVGRGYLFENAEKDEKGAGFDEVD